ncbi:MAG: hypothetical protein Fur0016_28910 [Anaerolineales bacterium]
MSPDRLTLTRSEALRRRREEEQKMRDKLTQKRASTPKPASAPKPAALPKQERAAPRISPSVSRSRFRARYDVAVMPVRGQVRAATAVYPQSPPMALPRITFGPRWFSLLLVIACAAMMYFSLTEPTFLAQEAVIHGNQRVTSQDINSVLGIANQPGALLNPAQIEYNIRASFPEIYGAYVQVELPAKVTITVAERQPVAAWMQDGQVVWVDAYGYAFPPRGQVEGLVMVTAAGNPPTPGNLGLAQTIGARPFLTPELSAAIATLAPQVPEGAALVYDPRYGLGWSDPRGWQAYFGKNNSDITTKLLVYQSLVENLAARGVQPILISVEYPNSPFYRVSKSD